MECQVLADQECLECEQRRVWQMESWWNAVDEGGPRLVAVERAIADEMGRLNPMIGGHLVREKVELRVLEMGGDGLEEQSLAYAM